MCPAIRFSVSATTRPPRPGEVDGRDYHFLTREVFRERIEQGAFVEWVENYGEFYGTLQQTLNAALASGQDLLLDIEPRGGWAIRQAYPAAVSVFILPPSLADLKARLAKRGEREETMALRLKTSLDEIRAALCYDYVVFNEALDEAVDRFRSIYIAEKSRRERCATRVRALMS